MIKMLKVLIRKILVLFNNVLIYLPIKKEQVLFESFNGKNLTDNPKAIYDALVQNRPELTNKLFWGIKGPFYDEMHAKYPQIQILKRWSWRWIFVSATANYWVFNSRMPTWWRKNRRTVYVQTWHGTPLKHLALDMDEVQLPGSTRSQYLSEFTKETSRWDYLIAANQYSEDIFRRAFQYNQTFLETGYPRNDVLIERNNPKEIKLLKRKIIGKENARIITYAPTWREDDFIRVGEYHFRWHFNLAKLMEKMPEDVTLLIRPHYLVNDYIDIKGFEDRVIVDSQSDMNEIYLISDLLITDYSSVMFDFAILKRPMLFFAYDIEHYRDQLRGFYFKYDETELPGPIVSSENDLFENIQAFINHDFQIINQNQFANFARRFVKWEQGNAANKVIELIGLEDGGK